MVAAARRADRLEALQVSRARELGWSWQEVADALGNYAGWSDQRKYDELRQLDTLIAEVRFP